MSVTTVESIEDWNDVLTKASNHPCRGVVLDASAVWCGPCKKIAPVFKSMSQENAFFDTLSFVKMDVDDADDLAANLRINAMPTFFFFLDRKEVARFEGADQVKLRNGCNSLLQMVNEKRNQNQQDQGASSFSSENTTSGTTKRGVPDLDSIKTKKSSTNNETEPIPDHHADEIDQLNDGDYFPVTQNTAPTTAHIQRK